jgi:hypothetical protein
MTNLQNLSSKVNYQFTIQKKKEKNHFFFVASRLVFTYSKTKV